MMLWWTYQKLRMGNAKSRLALVEELAVSGDDAAVGPLVFALKDKDLNVRCAAAKGLARFTDRSAVEPLIQLLRDPEPPARAAAAETLGQLGDPVAVNHLVGFLRDADPMVHTIAARSLERLGWKPGSDSHRVLQILAMGNLNQLAALGPEGVAPLLDLLRNGPPNRQFFAVKALGEMTDPRVRPAMIDALGKPSVAVRIAALGTLERFADPDTYPAVERLLRDPNPGVRGAAVEAAKRCGGARAVPALVRCLKDPAWEVRQSAVNALGSLGEHSAVDGLCHLISDPDRDVRETVIAALAQIGDARAIGPLVMALLDAESTVRAAATAALRKLDRHWEQSEAARQMAPQVGRALNHADYWVRYSAGKLLELMNIDPAQLPAEAPAAPALRRTPAPAASAHSVHPAAAVLGDLLFDYDRDLLLAAVAAFLRLGDKDAGAVLTTALRDPDATVREAVQAALAALAA